MRLFDLADFARRVRGRLPRYIQRTLFYEIFWRFRHFVDHEERAAILSDEQRLQFHELLKQVFAHIDSDVIESFSLAGCTMQHKVALRSMFGKPRRDSLFVYLTRMDHQRGRAQFSYFTGGEEDTTLTIRVDGEPRQALLPSQRMHTFLGQPYVREQFFWVDLTDGEEIELLAEGQPCSIRRSGKAIGTVATWLQLRSALEPAVSASPRQGGAAAARPRDRFASALSQCLGADGPGRQGR